MLLAVILKGYKRDKQKRYSEEEQTIRMEQGQKDRKYEWNRDKKTDNTNGIGTTRQTIRMEQGQKDRKYEWNRDKKTNKVEKAQHRKLKIEQHVLQ